MVLSTAYVAGTTGSYGAAGWLATFSMTHAFVGSDGNYKPTLLGSHTVGMAYDKWQSLYASVSTAGFFDGYLNSSILATTAQVGELAARRRHLEHLSLNLREQATLMPGTCPAIIPHTREFTAKVAPALLLVTLSISTQTCSN